MMCIHYFRTIVIHPTAHRLRGLFDGQGVSTGPQWQQRKYSSAEIKAFRSLQLHALLAAIMGC